MTDPFDKSAFQAGIESAIRKCTVPPKYSAISALKHIEKAGLLRNVDQEMCAYRLITAEEEASTAIFLSLKAKGYG